MHSKIIEKSPSFDQKVEAAELMMQSMQLLKNDRMEKGVFVDIENDPNETGLVGSPFSLITTDEGDLDSKLTTLDPNFAAVMVDLMNSLNIKARDTVAVLMTGSMADEPNNTYGWGIMDAHAALSYWSTSGTKISNAFPVNYSILKTYPNPFNPSINIEVQSKGESIIDITIISIDGHYVENIFRGKISNSVQTILWEPDNISSGIYFVKLINDKNQSLYKKITYLK